MTEILSPKLKAAIKARPTLTLLRDASTYTEVEFNELPKMTEMRDIPVPDTFDGREVWKGMLTPIAEQGECGSCWAWASTAALADRFNIQSLGKMNIQLSAAKLVLCDLLGDEFSITHPETESELYKSLFTKKLQEGACTGNTLADAWRYLYLIGSVSTSCIPDTAETLGITYGVKALAGYTKESRLPLCPSFSGPIGDMCADVSIDSRGKEYGTPARFYRCISYYSIAGIEKDGGSELNIRNNIYTWGPVSTGMVVYPDFYEFDAANDIYEWNGEGPITGGHAVRIVGWGEEKGKKYWIIANTWGPNWGRGGYFYMIRGVNNCKIEENVVSGLPDFFYPAGYKPAIRGAETEQQKAQREALTSQLSITGGGIDPSTGYTRRVMFSKPWMDFKPPISIPPDWATFVAGQIKPVKMEQKNETRNYFNFYSVIFLLCVIVLLILLFFLIKSKVSKR